MGQVLELVVPCYFVCVSYFVIFIIITIINIIMIKTQ